MQIDVRQQRGNDSPLRSTHLRFRPLAFLRHPGLKPFPDQAQYAWVGHPVLDELPRPLVAPAVEEPSKVRVDHPIHSLSAEAYIQRIPRLMRAAPRPEPVGETPKVHLVN